MHFYDQNTPAYEENAFNERRFGCLDRSMEVIDKLGRNEAADLAPGVMFRWITDLSWVISP